MDVETILRVCPSSEVPREMKNTLAWHFKKSMIYNHLAPSDIRLFVDKKVEYKKS
jgi:hypothetical protein